MKSEVVNTDVDTKSSVVWSGDGGGAVVLRACEDVLVVVVASPEPNPDSDSWSSAVVSMSVARALVTLAGRSLEDSELTGIASDCSVVTGRRSRVVSSTKSSVALKKNCVVNVSSWSEAVLAIDVVGIGNNDELALDIEMSVVNKMSSRELDSKYVGTGISEVPSLREAVSSLLKTGDMTLVGKTPGVSIGLDKSVVSRTTVSKDSCVLS